MPPRYAYWTILIDDKPTAFRATKQEELQPTMVQLQRTNQNVVMRWFARGKLWDDPEQAQWAGRNMEGTQEKRGNDWRPGGKHEDPRARFDRKNRDKRGASPTGERSRKARPRDDHRGPASAARDETRPRTPPPAPPDPSAPPAHRPLPPVRAREDRPADQGPARSFSANRPDRAGSDQPQGGRDRKPFRPREKPFAASAPGDGGPRDRSSEERPPRRAFTDRPQSGTTERPPRPPFSNRPPSKPYSARPPAPPFRERPQGGGDRDRDRGRPSSSDTRPPRTGDRPWSPKPRPQGGDRPWSAKPGPKGPSRPWSDNAGDKRPDRPWAPKPGGKSGDRPWSPKPAPRSGDRPWSAKPPPRNADRPWSAKPPAAPSGDRPWSPKPGGGGAKRPWTGKSAGGERPSRPPFDRDARRPPKTFRNPPPAADASTKKSRRDDDES